MAASLLEESTGKWRNLSESRQEMNPPQYSLMNYFGVILIATGVWTTETKSSQAMVSTTEPTTNGKPILRLLIVGGMAWQECPSSMHWCVKWIWLASCPTVAEWSFLAILQWTWNKIGDMELIGLSNSWLITMFNQTTAAGVELLELAQDESSFSTRLHSLKNSMQRESISSCGALSFRECQLSTSMTPGTCLRLWKSN